MKKILLLCGGYSSERDISIKSGSQVRKALEILGYDVNFVICTSESKEIYSEITSLLKGESYDLVYPVFHGEFGEDGGVQALLESLKIPYVGSGVMASSIGANKSFLYDILENFGVTVPKSLYCLKNEFNSNSLENILQLVFPLIVKPNMGGCSIGVSKVTSVDELSTACDLEFKYDDKIVIQEYVSGKEYTCPILGSKPLPVGEIKTNNIFFDFEAKYDSNETEEIFPAQLPDKVTELIQSKSLLVHNLIQCRGLSRSDFIYNQEDDKLVFIEINTCPGMTQMSLVPKSAEAYGWSFENLISEIIST